MLLPFALGSDLLLRSRPPLGSGVLPEPGLHGSKLVDAARPITEARLGCQSLVCMGAGLLMLPGLLLRLG